MQACIEKEQQRTAAAAPAGQAPKVGLAHCMHFMMHLTLCCVILLHPSTYMAFRNLKDFAQKVTTWLEYRVDV